MVKNRNKKTELLRKEETINEMKRVIKPLMKKGQEDKKIIENLKKEVEHRNGIIESITGENETLRTDGEKTTTTIHRCIEAIHSVK